MNNKISTCSIARATICGQHIAWAVWIEPIPSQKTDIKTGTLIIFN